ncbi:Adenylyl-sulfate kinase 3 [Ananas comosus]|uniref:Adenylyl-sulfate kinase 3 n=1 Tax=Ananas comosus TaxID=4615 RepID=A0A199W947_ANACO|nr:Adenylyl-sulfate kinase 3 [Ananas comosus]
MEPGGRGGDAAETAMENLVRTTVGMSTNIVWHECSIGKLERQNLLMQKGCVIWITGLSGSGKSTPASMLNRQLHCRGHVSYVLDGDNLRHGLNKDLSFKAEDRAENICRVELLEKELILLGSSKAFCRCWCNMHGQFDLSIQKRARCLRALVPNSMFIEFVKKGIQKALYKLARAGFTGIDDPYEPPMDCEIVIQLKDGKCPTPEAMAEH